MKRVGIAGAFHKANPVCLPEHRRYPCRHQLVVLRREGQQLAGAAHRSCGSSELTVVVAAKWFSGIWPQRRRREQSCERYLEE